MWWFKYFFIFFIIILNGGNSYVHGNLETLLTKCCLIGERWADEKQNCSDFMEKVPDIPIEMQGICLSSVEICCSRSYSIAQCHEGIKVAQSTQQCNTFLNETGSNNHAEYFKDCCEGCKIGIVVGSSDFKCSLHPFQFSPLVDTSFERCCNEVRSVDYIVVSDDTELCNALPSGKLCEQICINTPNSYRCECEAGYVLMEDNISCKKIEDSEANEIDSNIPVKMDECQKGYEKNDNGTCVDIDECDTGDATCDMENESCFNNPGSYMCIRITQKEYECQDGYRLNTAKQECQDINECLEETHSCHKVTHYCVNTQGGYSCQEKKVELCLPGLEYNPITKQCDDIDECKNATACDYGLICVNTLGSFICSGDPLLQIPKQQTSPVSLNIPPIPSDRTLMSCAPGYVKRGDNCVDIDECIVDKNSCDSHQNCINTAGSFRCVCKIGFILDTLQNACVDINECQVNTHDCISSQRCDNTIGSYNCIRLQGCGTGYTLNAATGQCEDDDECSLGRHNCEPPYECRNTMGSFRCLRVRNVVAPPTQPTPSTTPRPYRPTARTSRYQNRFTQPPTQLPPRIDERQEEYTRTFGPCTVGFMRNSHGACVDVNECDRNACRSNQRCVNTNGSYRCENLVHCATGYIANEGGTGCIDLDECETGGANCGPDQLCRNKPGGYICYCPQGHYLNKNNRCEDIDECAQRSCPVNANCINTVGSYRCECKEGFRNEHNEAKTCIDVDECTEIAGLCEQKCINYWGSYRCACQSGYRLSENNRTCEDLDECEINKSHGLCMGDCENTPGSYRCTCPSGYRLGADDRSCHDIDECTTQSVCRNRNEVCTNIRGGYRCSRIDCPHGYILDSERRNRCKLISLICDQDDMECLKRPTTFSYNFITLVSNMSIQPRGRALFNFKGPNYYDNIDFDFRVVYVNAPSTVRKANIHYFEMQNMKNEALLSLMRTLEGPQDIELEMSMTVYREGQPSGTNVAKIFIIVSDYPY